VHLVDEAVLLVHPHRPVEGNPGATGLFIHFFLDDPTGTVADGPIRGFLDGVLRALLGNRNILTGHKLVCQALSEGSLFIRARRDCPSVLEALFGGAAVRILIHIGILDTAENRLLYPSLVADPRDNLGGVSFRLGHIRGDIHVLDNLEREILGVPGLRFLNVRLFLLVSNRLVGLV